MFVLALINGPELLIADEPYSSLDEENQLLFLKTLEEEQKERNLSVIMVSHDWLISKNWADYFIIMNHGTIVDQGDLQTLEKRDLIRLLLLCLNLNRSGKNWPMIFCCKTCRRTGLTSRKGI